MKEVTDNKLQLKCNVVQALHKRGRALNDNTPCAELKHAPHALHVPSTPYTVGPAPGTVTTTCRRLDNTDRKCPSNFYGAAKFASARNPRKSMRPKLSLVSLLPAFLLKVNAMFLLHEINVAPNDLLKSLHISKTPKHGGPCFCKFETY